VTDQTSPPFPPKTHFLHVIDELESLGIEFFSRRENFDTGGPMGRLFMTLISSIAELESDLIRERVRAGMRRAKLEGKRIGRTLLDIDREQVVRDRRSGMSLTQVATKHTCSRATVCRVVREADALGSSDAMPEGQMECVPLDGVQVI